MVTTAAPAPRSTSWRQEASDSIVRGNFVVDAAVACEHVYRTMASRAFGRLVYAARERASDRGRVFGVSRLRDGRLYRQLLVLWV